MLNKLIPTWGPETDDWYLTFNGLMTTEDSIQIDESTAKELLSLRDVIL